MTRPVLPRISSSTSGLIFCGMIDEPVQNFCGRRRKLNSVVDQRIHSSAQPLRCVAMLARQKANSRTKSRVARTVEAVGQDAVELELFGDHVAVDGDARAGEGGGAERHLVDADAAIGESVAVAFEFFAVGEPVVGGQHGLGPLQVGVGRAGRRRRRFRPGRRMPVGRAPGGSTWRRFRRGPRGGCRSRPGRCGCGRCGACGRRRRSAR